METAVPNSAAAGALLPLTFFCWPQLSAPPALRSNTYAAPVLELGDAPTTTVSPPITTTWPKTSNVAASLAVSFFCSPQLYAPPVLRPNTYAAPVREFLLSAPTTMVSPLMATELPKLSKLAVSLPVIFLTSPQLSAPPILRAKTYAAPANEPFPVAPITAVSPSMAT